MAETRSYSLNGYGEMVRPGPRLRAYAEALRRSVRPGCTVIDLGAGPGVLSLLAARHGATVVHAIEPDDSILLGPMFAKANGLEDSISFHQSISCAVNLDTPADILVSDLRGVLPLFQRHIPSIVDARTRLLAPTGQLIPQRDTIHVAIAQAPDAYQAYTHPWQVNELGLDLRAAFDLAVNTWHRTWLLREQLLVAPQCWATLDYRSIEQGGMVNTLEWSVMRGGTAHGWAVWFDAELVDGVGFSNAPGEPPLIYGQAFFPLQEPVDLSPGDCVGIHLRADLVNDDYVWTWQTRVTTAAGTVKADFNQSTFGGALLSKERIARHRAAFVPQRSTGAEVDLDCLGMVDGKTSLEEISRSLAARHPLRFNTWHAALQHVAELLGRPEYHGQATDDGVESQTRERR